MKAEWKIRREEKEKERIGKKEKPRDR